MINVIVVCYKSEAWLERILRSLHIQSVSPDSLQINLIDNDDLNLANISLPVGITGLCYVKAKKNLQFGGGANLGIALANRDSHCSHILISNPDTWYEQDSIRKLYDVALNLPQFGIISGLQYKYDSDGPSEWEQRCIVGFEEFAAEVVETEWLEGSCHFISKRCLEAIGGYDPIYQMYYEDADLCRRARKAGFKVGVVPAAKYHHYSNASFEQKTAPERVRLIDRSQFTYQLTDPDHSWLKNHLRVGRWLLARTFKWLTGRQPGFGHALRAIFTEYITRYPVLHDNWKRRNSGDYFVPLPDVDELIEETYTLSCSKSANEGI